MRRPLRCCCDGGWCLAGREPGCAGSASRSRCCSASCHRCRTPSRRGPAEANVSACPRTCAGRLAGHDTAASAATRGRVVAGRNVVGKSPLRPPLAHCGRSQVSSADRREGVHCCAPARQLLPAAPGRGRVHGPRKGLRAALACRPESSAAQPAALLALGSFSAALKRRGHDSALCWPHGLSEGGAGRSLGRRPCAAAQTVAPAPAPRVLLFRSPRPARRMC